MGGAGGGESGQGGHGTATVLDFPFAIGDTGLQEVALDRGILTRAIQASRVEWLRHVLERMLERGISRSDVFSTLVDGEEIEDYPDDKPFPSALFLHWIGNQPLHVVAALDWANEFAFIITAYRPDLDHFQPDFKTRRKR